MVKSYAQTLLLKNDPARIQEYKDYHANSWPEVLQALKAVGILKMKIYLIGVRLFMYMETVDEFDPKIDFPRHMAMSPRCVEWGQVMSSYQEKAPEAGPDDWWCYMQEVYDFETQHEKFVGPL